MGWARKWATAEWGQCSTICNTVAAFSATLWYVFGQPVSNHEEACTLENLRQGRNHVFDHTIRFYPLTQLPRVSGWGSHRPWLTLRRLRIDSPWLKSLQLLKLFWPWICCKSGSGFDRQQLEVCHWWMETVTTPPLSHQITLSQKDAHHSRDSGALVVQSVYWHNKIRSGTMDQSQSGAVIFRNGKTSWNRADAHITVSRNFSCWISYGEARHAIDQHPFERLTGHRYRVEGNRWNYLVRLPSYLTRMTSVTKPRHITL